MKLPRYWKCTITALTGLQFCGRECPCGANSQLWWFPHGASFAERTDVPDWVPEWMNGADTHEIWRWLVENEKARVTT